MISSVDRRSEYVENRAGANVRLNNFLTPYTLDNKSSILNAPCGYSNGVYASLRPSDARGQELIVNGDFATDSDWDKLNATISGGKATVNIVGGAFSYVNQNKSFTSGKIYKLTAQVKGLSGSSGKQIRFQDDSSNNGGLTVSNGSVTLDESTQNIELQWVANSNSSQLIIARKTSSGDYSFEIDNVSVKEDTSADFEFTRGTAATRVTKVGLVKDVHILSDDLVKNGNFEEIGPEEVSNGDFSQQGGELITNGGFDSDTWWSVGQYWSIGNGFATRSVVGSELNWSISRSGVLTVGKNYKVIISVSSVESGNVSVKLGGTSSTEYTSVGTYTFYGVCTNNSNFKISPSNDFNGSIDNVSVVEVGQDWVLGEAFLISNNKLICDGSQTANSFVTQSVGFISGKTYRLTFQASNITSGQARINMAFTNGTWVNADGDYTFYVVASFGNLFQIQANNDFTGSITNISVKEVGQNWNFGNGWSMGDGVANYNNSSNNYIFQNISLNTSAYQLKFTISNSSSNGGRIWIGNSAGGVSYTDNTYQYYIDGDYTINIVVPSNQSTLAFFGNTGGSSFSIDNVSVIEITDDTNLPRIDYTNGTGALLLEPQSTNLIPYSEDFSQWDKVGTTVIANSIISPNGSLNSDKIEETSGGTYHNVNEDFGTLSSGSTYTASAFYKSAERTSATIYENLSNGSLSKTSFNLTNGTVTSQDAAHTATIKDYGTGWYKCSITFTLNASRSGSVFYGTSNTLVFTGVSGNGVYIWGAQVEQLPYASSYIPTNGSTVTRNQDAASRTGISNLINSSEGVLYAEIAALADDETNRAITLSDGTNNNVVEIFYSSGSSNIPLLLKSNFVKYE